MTMNNIPHIIHYCWFGRKPLPDWARKYIETWHIHFPNWEIKEWNEDNFDVNACLFTRQAYAAGKYAFVSDYARFAILLREGGVYFDTDVEVVRSFNDILDAGPFMGYETDPGTNGLPYGTIAPGLGLGAVPGMEIYRKILERYESMPFQDESGNQFDGTVVFHTTEVFRNYGLQPGKAPQTVAGVTIYPKCYFNPFCDADGKLHLTEESHSIHWYRKTWTGQSRWRIAAARICHRIFGISFSAKLKRFLSKKLSE